MTENQSKKIKDLDIKQALELAFRAGSAYAIGSHKCFKQTHLGEQDVVAILSQNIDAYPGFGSIKEGKA
jgi:hypothetical protein